MDHKTIRHYLTAVGLAGALALTAGAEAGVLSSSVSADKLSLGKSDDVRVQVTLRNDGPTDVYVLRWATPFKGIDDEIFEITRDGEDVAYTGRHIKFGPPAREDWMRIPAGGALSGSVELSASYDLARSGSYSVRYRVPEARVLASAGGKGQAHVAIESNAVVLEIDGLDVAAYDALQASLADAERRADEAATVPPSDFVTPVYRNCSTSQKNALPAALQAGQNYSVEANNYLTANGGDARYVRWFGSVTTTRLNTVKSHYQKIRSAFETKTITIDCGCTASYYAFVNPANPYVITVCNAFWAAPTTGQDSRGGTLVHEMSHFNVNGGTDDWQYGASGCRTLASTNPNKAVDNADSHEYYCELK